MKERLDLLEVIQGIENIAPILTPNLDLLKKSILNTSSELMYYRWKELEQLIENEEQLNNTIYKDLGRLYVDNYYTPSFNAPSLPCNVDFYEDYE